MIDACELVLPPLSTVLIGRPYASVPLLAAYAAQCGFRNVRQTDLNSPFFAWVLTELLSGEGCTDGPASTSLDQQREQRLRAALRQCLQERPDTPALLAGVSRDPSLRDAIYERLGFQLSQDITDLLSIASSGRDFGVLTEFYRDFYKNRKIPPLVGITVPFASQLLPALVLARTIRELATGPCFIVLGGPVPTLLSDEQILALLRQTEVNGVVRHEGESAFAALNGCDFSSPKGLEEVPGLLYLRNGGLAFNGSPAKIRLSATTAAPFDPDFIRGAVELPVMVGRGCYYRCSFCDYISLYESTNYRKIDEIIESVRLASQQSTTGMLHFIYEVMPLVYVRKLSAALIEEGLNVRWRGFQRVYGEMIQEDVRQLGLSGCRRLDIGLESADEPTLQMMEKGYGREEIRRFFANFRGSPIQLLVNIIINYPGLSFQRAMDAARFLADATDGLENVHFELMRFSLTTGSAMSRAPERFQMRIVPGQLPSLSSQEFLALNQLGFESDTMMSEEEAQAVERFYRELNFQFASRGAERISRMLTGAVSTAGSKSFEICLKSGPFLLAQDPGPDNAVLLRDLSQQVTFLVKEELAGVCKRLIALAGRALKSEDLLEILATELPDSSLAERISAVSELRMIESVERKPQLKIGISSDRDFFRGAKRPRKRLTAARVSQ